MSSCSRRYAFPIKFSRDLFDSGKFSFHQKEIEPICCRKQTWISQSCLPIPTRRRVLSDFCQIAQPANPEICPSTTCYYRILVSSGKVPKKLLPEQQTESDSAPNDPNPMGDQLSVDAYLVAKPADLFSKVLLLSVAWHLRSSLNGATQYTLQL
jgi:hypothetical protein